MSGGFSFGATINPDVRFWHKADIAGALADVLSGEERTFIRQAFLLQGGGKRD
jgi:hypothetical protein